MTASTKEPALFQAFVDQGKPEMAASILTAALGLFARKGYAATSVREIVQEANVTNPMLYYYFENKEQVFIELIEFLFEGMHEQLQEAIAQGSTLPQKVRGIVWAHIEGCKEVPVVLQFIYSVLFGPVQSRANFDFFELHRQKSAVLDQMFEDAIRSGELQPHHGFSASFLTEQLQGVINNHLMLRFKDSERDQPEDERLQCVQDNFGEEAMDRLVNFFLAGAGRLREDVK